MKYQEFIQVFLLLIIGGVSGCRSGESERVIYNDPVTGNEVWQITNHPSGSSMPYFDCQAFTADDTWVVFSSNRDDGVKIFRSNMATGEVSKLSDMRSEGGYTMMPDGKRVAFMNSRTLYTVDVATLETESIITFEPAEDRISFSCSFTADSKYTLVTIYNPETGTRIFRVDVPEKKAELVFVTPFSAGHPLINPRYPNLMTFCVPSEVIREKKLRNYIVDMNTGIAKPFIPWSVNYGATHESWSADGERQYFFRKKWDEKGRLSGVTVCSLDKDGLNLKEHYTSAEYKLGHGVADREQKWFISDVQKPDINPLIKIDLVTGEAEILCWPNSSQIPSEFGHVHPLISASGKYVAFTSAGDSREITQAFVIPVK